MNTIFTKIYKFFLSIGKARAASECARLGKHDLARMILATND
jgi:hypothetical protein